MAVVVELVGGNTKAELFAGHGRAGSEALGAADGGGDFDDGGCGLAAGRGCNSALQQRER